MIEELAPEESPSSPSSSETPNLPASPSWPPDPSKLFRIGRDSIPRNAPRLDMEKVWAILTPKEARIVKRRIKASRKSGATHDNGVMAVIIHALGRSKRPFSDFTRAAA